MPEKIVIAVLAGTFCSMFTALISLMLAPKVLKNMVEEAVKRHTDLWHQDSMYKYVEAAVDKHSKNCQACNSIEEVRLAVIWLVEKQGGDIFRLSSKKKEG